MEEKYINMQQLMRLLKKGNHPDRIRYLGIDYYYEDGNYYSTITKDDLASDLDKYPQLLYEGDKVIEIL